MSNPRRAFVNTTAVLALAPWLARSQATGTEAALRIGAVTVRVPSPEGFVETSNRAPDVYSMAMAYSAGDARILAHFVRDEDLKQFEKGKKVYFREFLLVQTPRRAESLVATQAQFDRLRTGAVAMQSQLESKLEPKIAAEVQRVSKAVSATAGSSIKVAVGEIVPVSIDRNDSTVLSYTILATAGVSESGATNTQNMVASASYCFLSGKVVMLNSYRLFRSPRDLQINRELQAKWIAGLYAAN